MDPSSRFDESPDEFAKLLVTDLAALEKFLLGDFFNRSEMTFHVGEKIRRDIGQARLFEEFELAFLVLVALGRERSPGRGDRRAPVNVSLHHETNDLVEIFRFGEIMKLRRGKRIAPRGSSVVKVLPLFGIFDRRRD